MVALSTILCLLAAALFWACNAIQIALGVQQTSSWGSPDKDAYLSLVPENIEYEWNKYMDIRGLEFASGFLNGIFWITFCLPITEMAWILSRNGTRSPGCNVGIVLFTLAGSWTKWFSSIFWNGMYISFIQMAKNFNLDNWLPATQAFQYKIEDEDGIGWRALEVNHIVTRGLVWIVNSLEWICLAVIFTLTFFSVMEWRKEDQSSFGGKWNALGLFIGLLCFIEFILEIVAFQGISLAWLFVILYAGVNRLILIPLWIIILGFQLPQANSKQFDSSYFAGTNELELSEAQNEQDRPANFTIDGNDDDFQDAQQPQSGQASPPAEAFNNALADGPKT